MPDARRRLLFVDDEPDILLILGETFRDDYDVLVAESGHKALELLEQGPVDLLITDQKMPHMKGTELIARARERYPDLVCVMLTAFSDPPDLIEVINRGPVFRYLQKPWDTHDLLQTVENGLAHAALKRENASLLSQTQRRLAALEAFYEVSSAAGSLRSYGEVIDEVAAVLERVVDLDASVTLVRADPRRPATLSLRCREPLGKAQLEALSDAAREAHVTLSGEPLADEDVLARFTGPGMGVSERGDDSPLPGHLFVPLRWGGRHAGVLLVASHRERAFDRDDERVLDLLANCLADALLGLRGSLDTERARLERMVEGMADGLVMTDAAGEVVVFNAVARTMLGIDDHHEITARMLRDRLSFYPFELVRGWERLGTHAVAEDVHVGERVLHSVVSPVTSEAGRLEGVVVVLRNVTEQRESERKRELFVSDITHEVRTPLTSILGALDLVLSGSSGELNEKQRQYLHMVRSSVGKLNGLIDDLLDLSKASQNRLHLELRPVDLEELVEDALERYRPAFEGEDVTLSFRPSSAPVRVQADGGRLDQVLNNLLTNAVRFTPAKGRVEVEIFAREEGAGSAGFSVWNSGAHIKGEDLERIFDQWEQADTKERKVRGTGLGLPICRRIVEAHGGRIWAESSEEKGASFVVVLPLHAELEADTGASELEPLLVPAGAHGRPGERPTVLIVDDDRAAAYVMKSTLLAAGFAVEVAHSADEALVLARRQRPAVMVVDVRMPEVDGVELIEILRNDPETRGTPIVSISGYDEAARARRARAHAFLPKPIDPARLVATLSELAFGRLGMGQGVLLLDDDPDTVARCASALTSRRYALDTACSLKEGRRKISEARPDLIVLDLSFPDGNGLDLLREVKSDRNTSATSIIVLSARGDTDAKVRALKLGADDYITKPFDPEELAARVEMVLRRRELELAASPTTRLPGGLAIEAEVSRRLQSGRPFTLCYLDLDNLKAFNDYYGYAKADGVIRQTGDLLREVVSAHGKPEDFIGHIAGDDFVLVSIPGRVRVLCERMVEAFSRVVPLYYNRDDRQRGYIEAEDRHGSWRRFPIMGLSAVAVTDPGGRYEGHAQIALRAAELKLRAKAIEGSVYLPDAETEDAAKTENTEELERAEGR